MKEGALIEIDSEGSFNAIGTAENPIRIFGEVATPGYWDAIKFDDSNNPLNELVHVHISDGGGDVHKGMITLTSDAMVVINHCVIENSARYGIYTSSGSVKIPDFYNNVISGCSDHPMYLKFEQLYYLDGTTDFIDNGDDSYVEVQTGAIENDVTWEKLSVPVFFNSAYLDIEADVTVEPGSSFIMGSGAKIKVKPEGSLNMVGTLDEPITFTGDVSSPGYWEMIFFDGSNNPLNQLEYVNISYGGNSSRANLWCAGSSRIEVGNSSFNHSGNYGIYIGRNVNFNDIGGNSFTGNTSDDLHMQQ